jgi:tetratricopeptide (TPR) repeat protein
MKFTIVIGLLLIAGSVGSSLAHEGPTEIIQRLSHRIDAGGARAEDFQRRAIEWRILGKSARAARDLRLALRKDPDYQPAWRELARVSLVLNDRNGAVEAARRALELAATASSNHPSTSAHLLLAEILLETGSPDAARKTIDEAFALRPQQGVDAWWLRGEILSELDDRRAHLDCLKAGWQQTGSEALRISWIDAAIESGKVDPVIFEIEESLERCRLKAAWRIRRARVSILHNEPVKAQNDLLLAMEELEGRLSSTRPDRAVVNELASARQLLRVVAR